MFGAEEFFTFEGGDIAIGVVIVVLYLALVFIQRTFVRKI